MGIMDLFRRRDIELSPPDTDFVPTGGILGDGEKHHFAEFLIDRKRVQREHAGAALMEQRVTGERIGAILVRTGFLPQEELVHSILEFNPDRIATEKVTVSKIPVEILEEVLDKAEAGISTENKVRTAILSGTDPQQAYLQYGKF